jgi:4-amino-4-deoxy-L-arabinose transferase-like glycosyltransferase
VTRANFIRSRELGIFSLLFLLALLLRLPFFFPAIISHGEASYILMGQSLLDGHLPYIEQWEDKPPLAYVPYALVIAALGRDIVGVRLAGTLCVALAAYLVYVIGRATWNRRTGIVAAILSTMTVGLLAVGQATLTEHIALVPLMGALTLLVSRETSSGTCFLAGMLMATSSLVRQNLAYVALALGVYLLFVPRVQPVTDTIRRCLAYAAGGVLLVAATWMPYWLTGQQGVWWTSVFAVPLTGAELGSVLAICAPKPSMPSASVKAPRG